MGGKALLENGCAVILKNKSDAVRLLRRLEGDVDRVGICLEGEIIFVILSPTVPAYVGDYGCAVSGENIPFILEYVARAYPSVTASDGIELITGAK